MGVSSNPSDDSNGEEESMARPRKNNPFPSSSIFLPNSLEHFDHHPRTHGFHSDSLCKDPKEQEQSKLRHGHFRYYPSSTRFWLLLLLAFVAAFLFLPYLSSTLLLLTSPSYQENLHYPSAFTLGGLLSEDSDTLQCKSRGVIHKYRSKSSHSPSSYLLKKLRKYEALHRRCGPGSRAFNKSARLLTKAIETENRDGEEKEREEGSEECKYIVWIADSGLGNRLISIASTFVYALLTDRVLLLDGTADIEELLCEPFPGNNNTSWILPSYLNTLSLSSFNVSSPDRFGLHLQRSSARVPPETEKVDTSSKRLPITNDVMVSRPSNKVFSYVHLEHDYNFYDKLFFCDGEHRTLGTIPWLFIRTNLYFLPSLPLFIPSFREELRLLFPDIDYAFHHIGRYLFFPTDTIWRRVVQAYDEYMSKSSRKVGIQIRTFAFPPVADPHLAGQILACAAEYKLLPKIHPKKEYRERPNFSHTSDNDLVNANANANANASANASANAKAVTSVLITSLLPDYYNQISSFYADNPTETIVRFYQPSHEVYQNTESHGHNAQALAEMWLLSLCDELITTPQSTFGYVAAGLAGIKPLMLDRVKDATSRPLCSRALSMDPCFHAPPYYNCDSNQGGDTSKILPYVKHCEDVFWGLKLFPKD